MSSPLARTISTRRNLHRPQGDRACRLFLAIAPRAGFTSRLLSVCGSVVCCGGAAPASSRPTEPVLFLCLFASLTLALLAAVAFVNGWRSRIASAFGMDTAPDDKVAVMAVRAADRSRTARPRSHPRPPEEPPCSRPRPVPGEPQVPVDPDSSTGCLLGLWDRRRQHIRIDAEASRLRQTVEVGGADHAVAPRVVRASRAQPEFGGRRTAHLLPMPDPAGDAGRARSLAGAAA